MAVMGCEESVDLSGNGSTPARGFSGAGEQDEQNLAAVPFLGPHHDLPQSKQLLHYQAPPPATQLLPAGDAIAAGRLADIAGGGENGLKGEIRDLVELLSKLNPSAAEFVPPSLTKQSQNGGGGGRCRRAFYPSSFGSLNGYGSGPVNGNSSRRKRNEQGKRRVNNRTNMAQKEEVIRRTVYVSEIDNQVTEEQLAALFLSCGSVVDCRICGDPKSVLRFAFVEFTDEDGARSALSLSGTMLGYYPVRVLPSKTTIAPVNPTFLPKITQADLKLFFESLCGEVYRLRLLGDYHHSTRIAFVEFAMADSAISALNCSGVVLGSLPIRLSPSKTPVCSGETRLPSL